MHHKKRKEIETMLQAPFFEDLRHNFFFSITEKKTQGISLNNCSNVGPLVQESEHAGMDHVQGSVGVAFFDNAGDIDFTGTCEGAKRVC